MSYLLDTGVLIRYIDASQPQQSEFKAYLLDLHFESEIHIAPQSAYEFLSVATRPKAVGGLALPPSNADLYLTRILETFTCVPDPANLLSEWQDLCRTHSVSGKQVHDARIVAYMKCIGISAILTLNASDFERYGIEVLSPELAS